MHAFMWTPMHVASEGAVKHGHICHLGGFGLHDVQVGCAFQASASPLMQTQQHQHAAKAVMSPGTPLRASAQRPHAPHRPYGGVAQLETPPGARPLPASLARHAGTHTAVRTAPLCSSHSIALWWHPLYCPRAAHAVLKDNTQAPATGKPLSLESGQKVHLQPN